MVFNSNTILSLGDAAMSGIDPGKNDLGKDHTERNILLALVCVVAAEVTALVWWLCEKNADIHREGNSKMSLEMGSVP